MLGRFQIGQQANLFQHLAAQVLRFVDNQYRVPAGGVSAQQMSIERVQQRFESLMLVRVGHTQFVTDHGQQFLDRQAWIQAQRDVGSIQPLFEQGTDQGGFPGADFARQLHESAVFAGAIQEVRQRLPMVLTQIDVGWIGRDRERQFAQTEVCRVHRYTSP